MRSPSSAFDARLLRGAALLVSSLFLATCERGPTAPAVPTQLAFSVQPTTTTAGHQITPAVQVTALDAGGRPVPGFTQNVTVTLTAGTGTSGATLTGTTTVAAANGVATFYALTLDKSSTGYTLTATASGLSAATSARFDINPGPATHLVFTVQPGNATAGATIAPAVEVTAQDASGNTVPTFTAQVTVALGGTNPSGGTLAGTKTVAAVSGVASFATLSIDKSGSYWLTAGAGAGLSVGTSSDFSVVPGPATQLAFTVQPVTTTAGHQIAPAVQLSALDALGNVVPSFTGDVTVALGGTNPSGGTLSGTTSVAAANGVAIFYALSLDKSGTGYTLTATASGLSAATSAPFDITPGAATHLVFTVQPANTTAGATLTPAVQVAAQDAAGNTVPSFTGSVTLALGGTNPAGGVLAGTTTVAAVNGAASFATLSVDKSGDYWLAARATGLSGGTSSDFSVSPGAATHLTFTVQPGTTTAGHQIAPAVKVAAQDALGNVVPSFTGSVTVALGSNPAGSTLSGSATVSAVSGVATFGDLSINTSGSGYTLTATATGLTGATSTPFGITPGAATHLVFTVQPANATAGTTLTPAVQVAAQDAAGNTVPSFSGSVTVALGGTNPAGGTLAGTTTVAAVNGVASFATLSIDKSGSYWLTATAPATGLSGGTSNDFSIAAGAATQLAFTVQPSNAVAGRTISPAVQVSARDAQGNLVTGFVGSVTMALGTNPGGSTLGGTTTVPAVSGVASFGNLSLDKVGTGYTLTAAAAGPTGATSNSFNVTVGAASQLVFTVQPTNTTAGATITPAVQVTVLDGQGNTATGFTGNVTVAFGSNPGGGTLAGTTTVAAVSGVASFASLSIAKVGTGYTLTAAAAGLPAATSAAFNVTPGTAAKLVFTVQPSNTAAGAAITPAVQVTAQDALGNTASGFTGTVTVALGANPVGGTLSGHTTVAASAGVATLADLSLDRAGTGYTLTAAGGGLSVATSAAFNITVGAATQLVFTVQPSTAVAARTISPAVQVAARDAQGNLVSAFAGSVTVALGTNPSGGTLAGTTTVTAAGGVATFGTLSVDKVGTGYTLAATAPGLSGATSSAFTVTVGAATQFVFSVQPSATAAGAAITPAVQVTALDAGGNVATGFAGSVAVALGTNPSGGTLAGTTTVPAVSGVASFASLSLNKVGSGYTLTAAAPFQPALTGATSAPFDITPGAATRLVFTTQPSNATAGATLTPPVQVLAQDAAGNTVPSFTGTVTVAITPGTGTSGAALAGTTTVAAVNGVASFATLSVNKSGTAYTLAATAAGLTAAASAAFSITPGTATQLAFTSQPGTATAGNPISPAVQVTAQDALGNAVAGFTGTVTVALGNNPVAGTLTGTTTVAATNGVASFASLSIDRAGSGYTLTAAATGVTTGSSAAFSITPGTAATLLFTVQPSNALAGAAITPAVQVVAHDAQGNTATGFSGNVTMALGANPGSGTLAGTTTVAAASGVATFANLSINKAGTGYTLTASASGPTSATSNPFTVSAAAATQLAFTVQPPNGAAGAALTPAVQVTARDAQGNVATDFTGTVTVALGVNPGGATLSGTTSLAAVSGVATFSSLSIDKVGTGYTLTAAATGLSGATSVGFNITPGAATELVFTVEPSNAAAGAAITPAVQVTARDAQGNTATGFTGTVTVALDANPGSGTLSGTTAVAAVAGLATFSSLSIDKVGSGYTLTAATTLGGLTGATSTPFDVSAAAASRLVFTVQPSNAAAGAAIAPAVQVTAQDAHGNIATAFTGTVTLGLGTNPGGGTLSGTATAAAVSGVATFANVSINKAGTGYTLTAAATGVTGTTSAAFNVTAGGATRLVFTVQPSNATAAAAITPAVQVTAQDALGNTDPSFSGSVTVALGSNPGGGALAGTTTVAAASGVATFANLSINRVGTGYTLTAAVTGLTTGTSAAFNITAGTATALVFTVEPSNTAAGVAITPAVQATAQDAQGNVATGFTGSVTMAFGVNPAGGTLSGTTTVAAVGGVATFSTLRVDKSGTGYALSATATGLSAATSTPFNVTSGTATRLAFTVQPTNTMAGATITPAVEVTAQDAFGNTVPGFTGSVRVAIGTNPAGGTLSGSLTVAAVGGVASFSTLSLNKSGTGYTLAATATGMSGATSTPFDIAEGTPSQLLFTVQPTSTTAGAPLTPAVQITAQDALGNTVAGFTGNVTAAITPGTGAPGATLSGTRTVAAVGGVATFSGLSIDKTGTVTGGTGYTLSATATGLAGATSAPFDINPGAPTQLAFTIQPTTATAGAHLAPPVEVAALDAMSNTVPGFTGNVTVTIGTNPAGGTVSGTTTVAAASGVATFSNLSIDKSGTGYTLAATATGLSGATSAAFTITSGPATHLVFTVQPSTAAANGTIAPAVRVTARDALGNTATGFQSNVTVAIGTNPAGGTLAGTTTLAAIGGVATFSSLGIDKAGTGYTLSAAATTLTGATSAPFDIVPSTATRLVFTVEPSTATAGAPITPALQITAQDASGNVVPDFTGNVTVAIGTNPAGGTLSGTTMVAAVGGVATLSDLSVDKSGSGYTLSAAGAGLTGATSGAFSVVPGAAAQLVFTVQPSTATAGASITPQVEVTARDGLGNTATGFTGNIALSIGTNPASGTLAGTTTVAAVAGVATFSTLSIDRAGSGYTLAAGAAGPAGTTSAPFDITSAPATRLVFTVQPTTTTAGAAISPAVQLTVHDALGNTVTGFTGDVTLTITTGTGTSGARLSGTTTAAAVAGVATFSTLSVDKSGTGYTLSATAGSLSGTTSAAFAVTPGSAAQLAFTTQPSSTTAGAAITPAVQVTARDALGNTVPGFSGAVTVAIGANPVGGTLSGTTTVAAVGGVATFSNLAVDQSGSGYTLTAVATGLTGATSAPFTITVGAATRLAFTVQPGSTTAGAAIAPAVRLTALDAGGNPVPGFSGAVTVAIGTNPAGGALSGTATVAAVAGVATFSTLSIDKSGTGYTLTATAAGLSGATSAAFAITPGSATQLVFTLQPTTATAGGTIKPAVRVTARDALGNTATGFVGNVTVAIGTNPAGGTLGGTRTFAAIAGVATFPSLSINQAGSGYTLSATAVGLTGATSAPFDIVPSTASQLVFTAEATDSQTAGAVITPALQVTAEDASGSPVTSFTGSVTVAIAAGTGISGATLSGTTTVAAVNGVATFSNLTIDKGDSWYTVTASATGLTSTNAAFRVFAGAATELVFRVQPSTATAGARITPQVEVIARDALGNTATGFRGDVTVAIGNNPGGGSLSGTKTAAAVAGVAAFPGLSINQAGGGYTLSATAPGLTAATSAPFDITAALASALVFTAQPGSTTAGVTINPPVQVTVRDASGHTATSFAGDVTLTITAGTGTSGATLSGTTTVAAVAGVATFADLSIPQSGSAYSLSATATGLAGATSSFFTINAGAPTHVTFTPQRIPGDPTAPWPTAGATIAPPVPVVARDALGNAVETFTGSVTVAIEHNPGGGTLSGTTTVSAVAGVATFNDLSIDRTGTGYNLRATASGLSADTSRGFIVAAGAPAYMVFTVQPTTTTAAGTMRPAVRVTAFDMLGNVATGFGGDVTLAITAGSGTSGAALLGTTTVTAVNGVAIFSTLGIDRVGSGYTLSAAAAGLTGATSTPFDIN